MNDWMEYLCYVFEIITFIFVILSCIIFGGLMCLGIYSFIQDLKLINNNLATDFTAIVIGYIFFKLSCLIIKSIK